jgi:3-isopropylmalate/(R)-2-methylmalate dehydratase small subunit
MTAAPTRIGGRCLKLGDNVNTDEIIPGRYLSSIDPDELAPHALEPLGEEVQRKLRESPVLVAGRNFGAGSAREQAATCLIGAGVQAVLTASCARAFFRNSINTGLLAVECPAAVEAVDDGDEVFVDVEAGTVEAAGRKFEFPPYPQELQHLLDAGGLIPYLARELQEAR